MNCQMPFSKTYHFLSDHAFHKKWAPLEHDSNSVENPAHLQLDISIVSRDIHPSAAVIHDRDYDIIEELRFSLQISMNNYNFKTSTGIYCFPLL